MRLSGFLTLIGFSLALCACAGASDIEQMAAQTRSADPDSDAKSTILAQLLPAATVRDDVLSEYALEERMAYLGVLQVGITVVRDYKVAWSENGTTLFQAASLAKPVAAAAIVGLAQERGVDLDDDIANDLKAFDLDAVRPDGITVSLARLLSHTSGAAPSGYPGYAPGAPLPTNAQVLAGTGSATAPPLSFDPAKYGSYHYGGAGYQLAQEWAEAVSGEDFAELVTRKIFDVAGMADARFAPLPDPATTNPIARGHLRGPREVPGGWKVYPELAAASLWSTSDDYAAFLIALMRGAVGEGGGLSPELARSMIAAVDPTYGLGVGRRMESGTLLLTHSGSSEGYKSYFVAWPDTGDALVVFTNSDSGWPLIQNITRSVARHYGLPGFPVPELVEVPLEETQLDAFAGEYTAPDAARVEFIIARDGARLRGRTFRGIPFELVHTGGMMFIDPSDAQAIDFSGCSDGAGAKIGEACYARIP